MPFWRKEKDDKETGDPSVFVARKEYDKAVKAYRAQIAAQPKNYVLNHKVADVLCMAGREKEALPDYSAAADGYAREGFLIKAIAILKKMQRIAPAEASVESRLASLSAAGTSGGAGASSGSFAGRASSGSGGFAAAGEEMSLDMELLDDSAGAAAAEEGRSIPVAAPDAGPEAEEEAGPPTAARMVRTPLFSELKPDELAGVISRLRHRSFAAGSILVKEGDPGDSLFVLSEGRVVVTTRGPSGKAVKLAELKEGDFFGEVSLLTGKPRTATITSAEDTDVLELTRDDLGELEKTHPRVREVVKEFYERRVASTIEAMIQAGRSGKTPRKG